MRAHVLSVSASPEDIDRFRRECAQYHFRWTCRDCVHVQPSTQTCSMEYPNDHLRTATSYLDPRGHYVFCKYFELP